MFAKELSIILSFYYLRGAKKQISFALISIQIPHYLESPSPIIFCWIIGWHDYIGYPPKPIVGVDSSPHSPTGSTLMAFDQDHPNLVQEPPVFWGRWRTQRLKVNDLFLFAIQRVSVAFISWWKWTPQSGFSLRLLRGSGRKIVSETSLNLFCLCL